MSPAYIDSFHKSLSRQRGMLDKRPWSSRRQRPVKPWVSKLEAWTTSWRSSQWRFLS